MKSLYDLIDELPIAQWNYYFGINGDYNMAKPFIDNSNYCDFIFNYFNRGGKVQIFESCQLRVDNLRLPNHICSVFFLGIILYYKTAFHKSYKLRSNDPGYASFPFIWFLVALFHDNAYQWEDKAKLMEIKSIADLVKKFKIEFSLFNRKFSKCKNLLQSRANYFVYRKKEWGLVDHGILGGLLLFDRLVKIRREKKIVNEENLFWSKKLENQYKTAANAISIHNIWPQSKNVCEEYDLKDIALEGFKPIKFSEFPLFFILGLVDTIEPLKAFRKEGISDIDILKSLTLDFGRNRLTVINNGYAKIDFKKLIGQTNNLNNWLDVDVKAEESSFELTFK